MQSRTRVSSSLTVAIPHYKKSLCSWLVPTKASDRKRLSEMWTGGGTMSRDTTIWQSRLRAYRRPSGSNPLHPSLASCSRKYLRARSDPVFAALAFGSADACEPDSPDRSCNSHLLESRDQRFGARYCILDDGNNREASWLATLSHTSVTQATFSSTESLATT